MPGGETFPVLPSDPGAEGRARPWGGRFATPGLGRFMVAKSFQPLSNLRQCHAPSRGEGRARPGLVARARDCGERGEEQVSDLVVESGWRRDFFSSLPESVAQKCQPVLRVQDMQNQPVGVGRVDANERDRLQPFGRGIPVPPRDAPPRDAQAV